MAWAGSDTTSILIDFATRPTAIQPVYITPDRTIFSLLDNWTDDKNPRDLGYFDGQRPRAWWNWDGGVRVGFYGSILVDGDRSTYNPPTSAYGFLDRYTFDLAVPVPAHRFGFFTPSQGYRSDGIPLEEDAIPAYEISISAETNEAVITSGSDMPIGNIIASVGENFDTHVQIEFPRQYVRFLRYERKLSTLDAGNTGSFGEGQAARGVIAEFELYGEGAPQRVLYMTKILDLRADLNFGRLSWHTTPMRLVDGVAVADQTADVSLEIEVRTGRDKDPNIYHEFTDKGRERIVSRDRYERELQPPAASGGVDQKGRPGLRASILHDSENWTEWSPPFTESGQPLGLKSGSHLQLKITLHSGAFDSFVRLDSLWIERAPLLARRIVGEVARLDNLRPVRGFTEVTLGEETEFAYDLRADFDADAPGFDAVRIRTGNRTRFARLEMGEPLQAVEPAGVAEEEDALVVLLPQRITPNNNAPVRIVFGTEIFTYATTFEGVVFDGGEETLPQPIEPGDATSAIATSSLRVLGISGQGGDIVQDLALSSPVITPNGDGVNDQIDINYVLFGLPQVVPVELRIFSLAGRRVAALTAGDQSSGPQHLTWNGRDETGQILPPGLYLLEVAIRSEATTSRHLHLVGIAY
ncbi:MAG: FlgD immunoglobulin-like domain containing protein [Candidatus Latescibacterota bacterium]|nr:FlgD immunoglobulin-like domain containing protein [Candidatus Latescibacterota bacterium]